MPNVKARIINKHDTEANWASAVNFTPLAGEIIIYDADNDTPESRIKIGDGATTVQNLPFITSSIETSISEIQQSIGAISTSLTSILGV